MIALSNNKGGSGKTTTTVSLASAFAERGLRVLVIDLDPQGSATEWLGGRESSTGLVEFSTGGIRVSRLVGKSTAAGVDLVPTSLALAPPGEFNKTETGLAIVRGIARLPDYWDLILIDTPPTLGHLSLAPLIAADVVVIPVEAHALALSGVATVVASIERARKHVNLRLELLGIIACRVTATRHAREIIDRLQSEFGAAVLEHSVREAIEIAEAPAARLPITQYAPTSQVANDYRKLRSNSSNGWATSAPARARPSNRLIRQGVIPTWGDRRANHRRFRRDLSDHDSPGPDDRPATDADFRQDHTTGAERGSLLDHASSTDMDARVQGGELLHDRIVTDRRVEVYVSVKTHDRVGRQPDTSRDDDPVADLYITPDGRGRVYQLGRRSTPGSRQRIDPTPGEVGSDADHIGSRKIHQRGRGTQQRRPETPQQAGIDLAVVEEPQEVVRGGAEIDVPDKVEDFPTESAGTDDDERRQLDRHVSLTDLGLLSPR